MKGTVKFFNDMKGFGFIAGEDGTEYFVHQTGLEPGLTLHENDAVVFDVEEGDRGPKAVNVKKDDGSQAETEDAGQDESQDTEEASNEEPSEEQNKESEE
jgi:cold shock protein